MYCWPKVKEAKKIVFIISPSNSTILNSKKNTEQTAEYSIKIYIGKKEYIYRIYIYIYVHIYIHKTDSLFSKPKANTTL